jgi:hypothetical protein
MEMIDGLAMVITLIAVAFWAKIVSARLSPELYQQLAVSWLARQKPVANQGSD